MRAGFFSRPGPALERCSPDLAGWCGSEKRLFDPSQHCPAVPRVSYSVPLDSSLVCLIVSKPCTLCIGSLCQCCSTAPEACKPLVHCSINQPVGRSTCQELRNVEALGWSRQKAFARLAASGLQKLKAERFLARVHTPQTVLGLLCRLPSKMRSCKQARTFDAEVTCNHSPQPQTTVAVHLRAHLLRFRLQRSTGQAMETVARGSFKQSSIERRPVLFFPSLPERHIDMC